MIDEMIKIWTTEMYDREIEEIRGTIDNEMLWVKGSKDKDEEAMHLENIRRFQDYTNLLEELKENVENF